MWVIAKELGKKKHNKLSCGFIYKGDVWSKAAHFVPERPKLTCLRTFYITIV